MTGILRAEDYTKWVEETLAADDPEWLVPGFIPAQSFCVLAGLPKFANKTWASYTMAIACATGQKCGPFTPTAAVPVLYIDLEGAGKPTARRRDMLVAGGMVPKTPWPPNQFHISFNRPFELTNEAHVNELADFVATNGIQLVVIDTLSKSVPGMDENAAKDMSKVVRHVDKIKRMGSSVLLLHHMKKNYQHEAGIPLNPTAALRGSSALDGAYDQIISISSAWTEGLDDSGDPVTTHDWWWLVGGKFMQHIAYKSEWSFVQDKSATLRLAAPIEVPNAAQNPRYVKKGY